MLEDELDGGVSIVTVPCRLGVPYAVWVPGLAVMVIAADTDEQQITAIMRLLDDLLEISAARDRTPTRSRET